MATGNNLAAETLPKGGHNLITKALVTTTYKLLNNHRVDDLSNGTTTVRVDRVDQIVRKTHFDFPINDLATLKQPPFHRTYAVNNDSGNYYLVGVLFMISIIGLLLYVNLYYEYCFRDTCYQMSQWKGCCFLKLFIITSYSPRRARPHLHHHHHHETTPNNLSGSREGENTNSSVTRTQLDIRPGSNDKKNEAECVANATAVIIQTPTTLLANDPPSSNSANYYKNNKLVQV